MGIRDRLAKPGPLPARTFQKARACSEGISMSNPATEWLANTRDCLYGDWRPNAWSLAWHWSDK